MEINNDRLRYKMKEGQEYLTELKILLQIPKDTITTEQLQKGESLFVKIVNVIDDVSIAIVATAYTRVRRGTRGCFQQLQQMQVINTEQQQELQVLLRRRNLLLYNFGRAGCKKLERMEADLIYKGLQKVSEEFLKFTTCVNTWMKSH